MVVIPAQWLRFSQDHTGDSLDNHRKNKAKILSGLFVQIMLASQPDITVIGKNQKSAHVPILSDRNFRKKEYEKLDKY